MPLLRSLFALLIAFSVLLGGAGCAGPRAAMRTAPDVAAPLRGDLLDHQPLDAILGDVVDPVTGGVDYPALRAGHLPALESYLGSARLTEPARWSVPDQKVFWVNVHNAAALHQVASRWPIRSLEEIRGPLGPWPLETRYEVAGRWRSLAEMQQAALALGDPRLAFVLNWGARGCAPLSSRALRADRLERDVRTRTDAFLGAPGAILYDTATKPNRVSLPAVVGRFAGSFAPSGQRLLPALQRFAPIPDEFLGDTVVFRPFDWRVNAEVATPEPAQPAADDPEPVETLEETD